ILKRVREGAKQTDAAPPNGQFAISVYYRPLRLEQGIEAWSEVFDGKDQLPLARPGELDCHWVSGARRIAVADDVGNRFLKAKMDGELKFVVDAITGGEAPHPLREVRGL